LKRVITEVCPLIALTLIFIQPLHAASTLTADEARITAAEAFVYGFGPILLESYRQARMQVLGAPNHMVYAASPDTHRTMGYFAGYLDLSKEPVVLCLPDVSEQKVMLEVMGAYADVIRVQGLPPPRGSGCWAVTGPGWEGRLPTGMAEVRSPTNGAWIFGRTLMEGPQDKETHETFMGRCSLTPLSRFTRGSRTTPSATGEGLLPTSPVRQVLLMDMQAFFGRLALFMKRTPPPASDTEIVGRMARIGIDARNGFFDTTGFSPAARKAIEQGMKEGMDKIRKHVWEGTPKRDGWMVIASHPNGTDYLGRSVAAYAGLGEPLAGGATVVVRRIDEAGNRLNGAGRYVLHLDEDHLELSRDQWSLAVLDADLCPLPRRIQRTALGGLDGLQTGSDGSVEILIQKNSPGPDRESNWLQVPEREFTVMMRTYGIGEPDQNGGILYPSVERMEE